MSDIFYANPIKLVGFKLFSESNLYIFDISINNNVQLMFFKIIIIKIIAKEIII